MLNQKLLLVNLAQAGDFFLPYVTWESYEALKTEQDFQECLVI